MTRQNRFINVRIVPLFRSTCEVCRSIESCCPGCLLLVLPIPIVLGLPLVAGGQFTLRALFILTTLEAVAIAWALALFRSLT